MFFRTTGGSRVSHVGIYSGNGQFIHASTRSKRVRYDRMDNKYFTKRFATARRVLFCEKLAKWFEERWNDRWCVDISDELAQIIDESWA